jgi:hypothetical protein
MILSVLLNLGYNTQDVKIRTLGDDTCIGLVNVRHRRSQILVGIQKYVNDNFNAIIDTQKILHH